MVEKRASSRRDFLRGRAAAHAVADLAARTVVHEDAEQGGAAVAAPAEPYLVQFSRRAMACEFEVSVNAGQCPQASDAALAALDLVDVLEEQLTIYRDTSELSAINRDAGQREVAVEPRLFRLLEQCLELHRETKGAFDIATGRLSRAWGFARRAGAIPSQDELAAAMRCSGSDKLGLDCQQMSVRFASPGVELNLGSVGKGYALDRCAELLAQCGVEHFMLHGGQSSVLAQGTHGSRLEGGWSVGLRDPVRPERRLAEIHLRGRGLSTSGASVQFFRHAGKRYGHILDPRTGWPAEGVFSATVVAPTAAEADALSTAFYVAGLAGAEEFCSRRRDVGALLLHPGPGGTVETIALNLGPSDWRRVERRTD